MTALAPHLSAFLREHLPRERNASRHTSAAYACTYKLLLCFAADRLTIRPAQIEIEHLNTATVLAFLDHIEGGRANTARSRNARLAAIKAFFRYLEFRLAACLDQARQIQAIPMKKFDEALIDYLTPTELQAVLNAPDLQRPHGRRDAAMLHLAFAGGLRVSELTGLQVGQLDQRPPVSVHIIGKGRRERVLPLWKETWEALRTWLRVRPSNGDAELFLNARGRTMSRFGFAHVLLSTSPSRPKPRPPWPVSRSRRTCCAIPARCTCSKPPAMFERSRSGSGTPACRAPRSTFAAIRAKNSRPSTRQCPLKCEKADSATH